MQALTIDYPTYSIRLSLTSYDELDGDVPEASKPVQTFIKNFYAAGAMYGVQKRVATSEDYGRARNLLAREDPAMLLEYARLFWRGHADTVLNGTETRVFRLFDQKLPLIKEEI